ncbi:hypothetical protein BCR37DRAFT_292617 [Protomyces lactucae-debilis]|uniref:Uncharacterized protein n=1 Tax=Protomyces lactucae-debilis TaxID=2754530 RepID=A0A1Y2FHQ9_PROLT|nr:uncharacterized protein BCR37DRAFT_292617 [Protomyces lactucae-debilis]ORY83137.1 hypothetical protein BCR37DRAFT_292617 [Protomyces lactucae-debilis]
MKRISLQLHILCLFSCAKDPVFAHEYQRYTNYPCNPCISSFFRFVRGKSGKPEEDKSVEVVETKQTARIEEYLGVHATLEYYRARSGASASSATILLRTIQKKARQV